MPILVSAIEDPDVVAGPDVKRVLPSLDGLERILAADLDGACLEGIASMAFTSNVGKGLNNLSLVRLNRTQNRPPAYPHPR